MVTVTGVFLWLWDAASRPPRLTGVTVGFAWPEYRDTLVERDPEGLDRLRQALENADRMPLPEGVRPHFPYWRITLGYADGREERLIASRELDVFDPAALVLIDGPELREALRQQTEPLAEGFFGAPLRWETVDPLWPWDTQATVTDLETGIRFRVDRYGGYRHADAQPVTVADTETMKRVFGDEWSWKRRAVVLERKGKRIAASMNGMPHGYGTIENNDFPGHFCIHFWGSFTHGSNRADNGHRLMLLKASGRLAETLAKAPPADVATLALTAVNQDDLVGLRGTADRLDPPSLQAELFGNIEYLDLLATTELQNDGTKAVVTADAVIYYAHAPDRGRRRTIEINLVKPDPKDGWKIAFASLSELLAGKEGEEETGEPEAKRKRPLTCGL